MPRAGPAARVLHCSEGAACPAAATPLPRTLRDAMQQLTTGMPGGVTSSARVSGLQNPSHTAPAHQKAWPKRAGAARPAASSSLRCQLTLSEPPAAQQRLCSACLSPRMMGGGANTRLCIPPGVCSPPGRPVTPGGAPAASPARVSGVRSPSAAVTPRVGFPGPEAGCGPVPAPPAAAPAGSAPSAQTAPSGEGASRTLPRAVRSSRRARPPPRVSPAGSSRAAAPPAGAAAVALVAAAEASQASSAATRAGQDGASSASCLPHLRTVFQLTLMN